MYTVEIEPRALKGLRSISRNDQERILARIEGLAEEPRPAGCVKLKGMGDSYRIRQGDYRIIYDIDDTIRIITITKIGNRKEVYD